LLCKKDIRKKKKGKREKKSDRKKEKKQRNVGGPEEKRIIISAVAIIAVESTELVHAFFNTHPYRKECVRKCTHAHTHAQIDRERETERRIGTFKRTQYIFIQVGAITIHEARNSFKLVTTRLPPPSLKRMYTPSPTW
jgi:hypothetical protein